MRPVRALGVLFAAVLLAVLPTATAVAAAPPVPPTRVLAISGHGTARVAWFAPTNDGGSDITSYRVYVSGEAVPRVFPPTLVARTITGLTNGVSYTFRVSAVNADGESPLSVVSNAVTPRPRAGQWLTRAPMSTARIGPLAVKLTNGRVLVVGGTTSAGVALATAELYNPATNTWSSAGAPGARVSATLTLLPGGKVLLAGGINALGVTLSSAKLYNPGTNSWSNTGAMSVGRANTGAVLLSTGKVLVAGGLTGGGPAPYAVTPSAQLYNPATGTWAPTGAMGQARQGHSLNLINGNTQALAAGGSAGGAGFTSSERYRSTSGTWVPVGPMSTPREFDDICCKTSVKLSDGRLLVAGGYHTPPGVLRTAEVFRPATNNWANVASMRVAREAGTAPVLLTDGRVLVVGGLDDYGALAANDLYNPAGNSWVRPDDLRVPRTFPAAVRLSSGRVLVVGGATTGGAAVAGTEVFTP